MPQRERPGVISANVPLVTIKKEDTHARTNNATDEFDGI